ncbi:MAG: c-type cytochrome biogenesis protein CcmI [Rugosibacter sp.]|nr:c-type cytochrome biogenesis protein CcmI [Rugosibacter sp.]MDO9272787.1 c-type cytochrome biogenesis protein CcmI [Rugosibacter sp.]
MNSFFIAAAALTLAALVLLLRPWWRGIGKKNGQGDQHRRVASADYSGDATSALNTTIHRDRLAELERDYANHLISAADYAEARDELQHQLLDDASAASTAAASPKRRWDGWVLAALLPAAAIGLYVLLGNPDALLSSAERNTQAVATMNGMISQLEKKLAQTPDDMEGWVMLARAYKVMSRWDDAERAYGRAEPLLEKNASLLAELADVLLQKTNNFAGRPHELIVQALQLEPDNGKALLLAGAEALAGKNYAAAIGYWERLQAQMDPASDEARMIAAGIARAREVGGVKVGAGDTAPAPKSSDAATMSSAVSGRVELSPALRVQTTSEETVFIFARAVNGSRMPLAVQRVRVADLPFDFKLDDSQAMSPDNKISSAKALRIEVRVSKSGQAMPASGDLTGSSTAVKPGTKGIRVVIDQRLP